MMMNTLKKIINSPITRWIFLLIALAALLWVIIQNLDSLIEALVQLPAWIVAASLVLSVVYVFFTLWSWRTILADLGSPLGWNASIQLFGISQIGKYIPGGVWNIVAAAQIGRDYQIPARRSATAMTLAVFISLLSGTGIGVITVLGTSVTLQVPTWLIVLLLLALIAFLTPPVLNRLIALGFKILKRPAPEHPITAKGLIMSTLLAVVAWCVAGVQVWLLAVGFGMELSVSGVLLSIGAYALAWVVGFLVMFIPAGTGVRESVLGLFFAGILSSGGVLAVVLVSRIAMTIADLLYAGIGAVLSRNRKRLSDDHQNV